MNILENIGRIVINTGRQISEVLALFFETLYWIAFGPFKNKFVKRDSIFSQMVFAGIGSLIIAFFVAFFTGIVIAMQSAYQLSRFGANIYVAPMVSVGIARELGPVLTALVVAGRVGAAIAAELGTMKVTEQIEALETMALNPVRFLVGVFNLHLDPYRYITFSFKFMALKDVWTGLVKSVVFGITIAMVGCYMGLKTKGGAEGVGRSTTLSVVTSFILIILFDCILTGLFYFMNK